MRSTSWLAACVRCSSATLTRSSRPCECHTRVPPASSRLPLCNINRNVASSAAAQRDNAEYFLRKCDFLIFFFFFLYRLDLKMPFQFQINESPRTHWNTCHIYGAVRLEGPVPSPRRSMCADCRCTMRVGKGIHPDGVPGWCQGFSLDGGSGVRAVKVIQHGNRPGLIYNIGP